jgi:hypothetical protein
MATFNKFNTLVADLANGVHNLATNQLTVALTNTAPTASNSILTDITQISYTNLSSRNITTTSSTQSGGLYSLVLADLTLTATGAVGPFQYVVIYNETSASDSLICWYDRGSAVTLQSGDSITIDFIDTQKLFELS